MSTSHRPITCLFALARRPGVILSESRAARWEHKSLLTIIVALAFLAASPKTEAVVPAPEGGYPGGNTAEGQSALFSLTTGGFNTAVGYFSLRSNTDGQFNTAI